MAAARVTVGSDSDYGSENDIQDDYLGGDDSGSDGDGEEAGAQVSGITDVMAKILNNAPPKDSKGPILARGQTDRQIKKRKKQKEKEEGGAEGKSSQKKKKKKSKDSEASSSDWSDDSDEEAGRRSLQQMQKRKEWNDMCRVKPTVLSKEKERRLQKIATRGVVQIFNVVRQQQSLVGEKLQEAGPSVRRRDKVMGAMSRKQFLDMLDHTQAKSARDSQPTAQADRGGSKSEAKWSILRDDYMMKASMKDWDRDDDNADDDNDDR